MRTRIKICGITRVADGLAAVSAGADAIGLVFYDKSPRNVSIDQAAEICKAMPSFVSRVALFVDESPETVKTILKHVEIDCLQFHGSETNEYCKQFGKPFFKAIHAKSKAFLDDQMAKFPDASSLLLDTYVADVVGGSGKTFDWTLFNHAKKSIASAVILAGGLTPENIVNAIVQTQPYAVDVSGGVEASKGIKDSNKIEMFIDQVKQADLLLESQRK